MSNYMLPKPQKGQIIIRRSDQIIIGRVTRTEDDLCHYTNSKGDHDMFIWKMRGEDGKPMTNKNVSWEFEAKTTRQTETANG